MTDDFKSRLDHAFQLALKKHSKSDVAGHVNLLIEAAAKRLPSFCKHYSPDDYPDNDAAYFWDFVHSKSSKEMIELFHLIHTETLTEENESLHQEVDSYMSEEKLEQLKKEKMYWGVMAPEGSRTWILQKTIEDLEAVRDKYTSSKMVDEENFAKWKKQNEEPKNSRRSNQDVRDGNR